MQSAHEKSTLSLEIGNDQADGGKLSLSLEIHFYETKITEQIEALKSLTSGNMEVEWAVVGSLSAKPGQADKLAQIIEKQINKYKDKDEELILFDKQIQNDRLLFSIRGDPDYVSQISDPLNMFFEQGLSSIIQQQENFISARLLETVDINEFYQNLKTGNILANNLFKNLRFELTLQLHQLLAEKIQQIVNAIDPEFANEPPMVLFQMLKGFDINLRFKDTDQLPQNWKSKNILGKKLTKKFQGDKALNIFTEGDDILQALGDEHEIWLTIPNLLAARLEIRLPGAKSSDGMAVMSF